MAHFARLNDAWIVQQVVVVANAVITDENGIEQEALGQAFCRSLYGEHTRWVQTSYNASFYRKFAAIGDRFDPLLEAFIAPQPYPSWQLNIQSCQWEAPVARPDDGAAYLWDEAGQRWVRQPFSPAEALDQQG